MEAVLGVRANEKVFTDPSATEKMATPGVTGINQLHITEFFKFVY